MSPQGQVEEDDPMAQSIRLVSTPDEPLSIQGEQQEESATIYAEEAEVDRYVDSHDPGVVACRERGRHDYPTIRQTGLHFVAVNSLGLHVRRARCQSCNLVDIVEEWDVQHRRGVVTRVTRVSGHPDYSVRGPNGERYLATAGHGRMTPKMVRSSVGTQILKGVSFKEIRKEIRALTKQEE